VRRLALALLLAATPAAAECPEADELAEQIEQQAATVQMLIDAARPVCAEKALARECAHRRVEIAEQLQMLRDLQAQRKAALKRCAAQR
jgi:hypothetical protein